MYKETRHIYKYDQRIWPYLSPNTTFIMPTFFDRYIQTQRNNAHDASVGGNDVASSGLDQSINHRVNMEGRDNDGSQSYETPWKNNCRSSSLGDIITNTTTPQYSTLHPPIKYYICFQIEVKSAHAAQCDKSRALIKVLKALF